ncbi:hypothetical protein [Sediminibacillus albus]|uniref:Uncharacterized protein n=1 Tax=Sediminibacillus albus TaxID=407036 RepID=A0A1G8X9T7_9BACI|nr:hypothetical protein [Sediminibacillus albus]SDJ87231.1 hypothetical protein SAMN05216243_1242 [Sediminibacillus albus]
MGYILLFLIGFGLAVSGGVTIILYLNFIPGGLSWLNYFLFMKGRLECYFFPIGLLLLIIAIHKYPE